MPAQRLGRRPERHAASTAPKRLTTPSTALRGHTRSSVQTHNTEHGAPGSAPVTCYTTPSIALRGHTRSSVKRCTGRSELRLEQSGPQQRGRAEYGKALRTRVREHPEVARATCSGGHPLIPTPLTLSHMPTHFARHTQVLAEDQAPAKAQALAKAQSSAKTLRAEGALGANPEALGKTCIGAAHVVLQRFQTN
jgi:hypothetical protein